MPIETREFAKQVNKELEHLYDTVYLAAHPLERLTGTTTAQLNSRKWRSVI